MLFPCFWGQEAGSGLTESSAQGVNSSIVLIWISEFSHLSEVKYLFLAMGWI